MPSDKRAAEKKRTDLKKIKPAGINISTEKRVVIEKVDPRIDGGLYPVKRVVGEKVVVSANVFADGHESVTAVMLWKKQDASSWKRVRMKAMGNDRWAASFTIDELTGYSYTVRAALDRFGSWRNDIRKKAEAGQDIEVDIIIGRSMVEDVYQRADETVKAKLDGFLKIERGGDVKDILDQFLREDLYRIMLDSIEPGEEVCFGKELNVSVDREKALFSAWYEFFPRSWGKKPGTHGTLKDSRRILPEIARMGFDVVYLPPVHPVGKTNRKGRNNSTRCLPGDPGSPWAIGSGEGGHKDINPELGTIKDFQDFVKKAAEYGIETAIDLAYQCSPDHPYVERHPEWFNWRPDGTVQFAENPPKKYEDVLPLNFETPNKKELWEELKSVVVFWIKNGIKIFRVDNPHTKPFVFWDWLIAEIKKEWPEVIFLAEAFTRPNVMYRVAKSGFSQSYTYFTWRITKKEITDYITELTRTEIADIMRPNFWPNTPDILPEHLQYGGRPMFVIRAVLAAMLSSSFGIYGPAFELCVSEAVPEKEEYLNSEKYEIKAWDWDAEGNLKDILARLNAIRKENPALRMTRNVRFCDIDNDNLMCFYKATGDLSNIILVVVSLDAYHTQSGILKLPLFDLGIDPDEPYLAHDLFSGDRYMWQGDRNYVELDPHVSPAHIIKLRRHIKREQDFDYFM